MKVRGIGLHVNGSAVGRRGTGAVAAGGGAACPTPGQSAKVNRCPASPSGPEASRPLAAPSVLALSPPASPAAASPTFPPEIAPASMPPSGEGNVVAASGVDVTNLDLQAAMPTMPMQATQRRIKPIQI
jgi:hypothetical protein